MRGRPIEYLPQELDWIERHSTLPRREAWTLFCAFWDRADVSLTNFNALCRRKGWMTGRTGHFPPGVVSHRPPKGRPVHPNSARHLFRKGNMPHSIKYLGHERLSKDGYVEISVDQVNPHTGYERRYVQKHRWLWEQAHGPVPEGMALKSLDGDRTNTDPANWEAVPRALLPRLNGRFGRGYDDAPAELKPVIMAVTKLEHQIREAGK